PRLVCILSRSHTPFSFNPLLSRRLRHPFPTRRSSDLVSRHDQIFLVLSGHVGGQGFSVATNEAANPVYQMMADYQGRGQTAKSEDRKSTRLNSSHVKISYAVFCLKKKTKHRNMIIL